MKKLLLWAIACLCVMASHAERVKIGDLWYELMYMEWSDEYGNPHSDRSATVTYESSETDYAANAGYAVGDVIIPESVEWEGITYPVTQIGNNAFRKCIQMTSITIPASVTYIRESAFQESGLREVEIPSNVTSLGNYIFCNCKSLTNAIINNGIKTLPYAMFYGCENLTSVSIPEPVTSIEGEVFRECSSLESINLPNTITSIGSLAFYNCSSLKEIVLPKSLKGISDLCFWGCEALESIDISAEVAAIGDRAFQYCDKLQHLSLPENLKSIANQAFCSCRKISSIILPEAMVSIGSEAFNGCSGLREINIPKSLVQIGNNAFIYCHNLRYIYNYSILPIQSDYGYIYDNCEKVGNYVFYDVDNAPKLAHFNSDVAVITLPADFKGQPYEIGAYAFAENANLQNVQLPDFVTEIGEGAFRGCTGLIEFNISEKIASIGDRAFEGCTGLKEITIPATVQSIGYAPFLNCNLDYVYNYSLAPIDIYGEEGNVITNAKYVFNDMQKDGDYIYTYVHSSPELAFLGDNLNATEIVLPEKVLDQNYGIGHGLFQKMKYLKSVTLPEGLTGIGTNAFDSCVALKSIIIPNSVKKIGDYAFRDCAALEYVEMPNTVESLGYAAFRDCKSLKGINLPQTLTALRPYTFYRCKALTAITLPDNIKTIDEYTFYECENLSSVHLPTELEVIGYYSFTHCSSLQELILPQGLKEIHNDAFYDCWGIKRVYNYSALNIVKTYNWEGDFGYLGFFADRIFNDVQVDGDLVFTLVSTEPELSYYTGHEDVLVLPNDINGKGYGIGQIFDEIDNSEMYDYTGYIPSEIILPENLTYISGTALRSSALGTVRFKSNIVPTIDNNAFTEMQTIVVPAAAYSDYVDALPNYEYQIVMEGHTDFNITADAKENRSDVIERITNGQDERYAYNVVNLKINGTINSYDVMALRNKLINLRTLDLSDAVIVANNYEYLPGYTTADSIIGPEMFRDLDKLKSVILPKSTKSIESRAFKGCRYITSITIPENVTKIGYEAFTNCHRLKEINFNEKLQYFDSDAFYECYSLTSIVIPDNVESISGSCFRNCYDLESVTFPKKLKSIGTSAFSGCRKLKEIQLPTTLRSIEYDAFSWCTELQEVKIPSSINYIGDYAFNGCNNIKRIYTWTIAPTNINLATFSADLFKNATLYVPESGQYLYYYDTQWSQFLNIKTFNEPYEYFYLANNDLLLDEETVRIDGEEGNNPDADMTEGAGLIVQGDIPQDLGEVTVDTSSSLIAYDSEQPNISIDRLVINIAIQQDRWYFFCFPFDVPKANIFFNGQFQWCYYDGEYRAEHGSGAWRDAEGDLNANQGYIFIGSKNGTLSIAVDDVDLAAQDAMIALESYAAASTEDASWNLVGNPYTSYYNLADLGYTAPITFWNPETYSYEAYNPEDDDVLLYPYQAFFVQKTEDEEGVGFENEYQTTYLQSQEEENQMAAKRRRLARARHGVERFVCNVELSNVERSDRTRVVFNEESEMHYEIGRDASKFLSNQAAQIYTLDSKNVYYAINERPMAEGVVRLGITTISAGTYTISASRLDTPLYLIDLQTGECTDLSVASYEFDTARGTDNDRLVLSTEPDLTALRDINADADADAIYYDLRGINRGHDMPTGISITSQGQKMLNR